MTTPEADYTERVRVLLEMDTAKFYEMLNVDARTLVDSVDAAKRTEALLGAMHRARYELLEAPEEARAESMAWLKLHNLRRLKNRPWPGETMH